MEWLTTPHLRRDAPPSFVRVSRFAWRTGPPPTPVPRAMNFISIARAHAKPRQRTLDGDQVRDLIQVRAYASHLCRDSRYGLVTIVRMISGAQS